MPHQLLVETNPHQTRVAVLEDDRLTEIFVERHRNRGLVGNVYKGRVTRVLPGMQAAFVDIGLERDAFLYVTDVIDKAEELAGLELASNPDEADEPDLADADENHAAEDVAAAAAGAEDDETGAAASDDAGAASSHYEPASIDDLLKPGQEIPVQVVKDPLPNKGARISTHVTLPGRYLVLLPTVRHLGVSRRIEDEDERRRLLELLAGLDSAAGLIVRTVGEGKGAEEFSTDLEYLESLWEHLRRRAAKVSAPTLLHRDHDLALRIVRDVVNRDFSVLWVDSEETYERLIEFLDQVQPTLVGRLKLYRSDEPLFDRFGVEEQIEAALRPKVWLKSGGYLVINPTEALVAIDVNTGRFVGSSNLEDTVLHTNLEAVREIVRQIRLRDLGGILVVDLIDMTEKEHRDRVFALLEEELKKDRAKNKVLSISEFGLVEITRKRSRANLERLLTQPCPYCAGGGRVKSISTICLNLRRDALGRAHGGGPTQLLVRVHPSVAEALQREERAILDEIEQTLGSPLLIQSDPELHQERYDVTEI